MILFERCKIWSEWLGHCGDIQLLVTVGILGLVPPYLGNGLSDPSLKNFRWVYEKPSRYSKDRYRGILTFGDYDLEWSAWSGFRT